LSVRQLNFYVKSLLEGDVRLANVAVSGEISNFKNHYSSGHWYFSLKDNEAQIRCVMFRFNASKVKFAVKDGMQVIVRGKVSLYEKDGQYQFYAESMSLDGIGDIALAFEQIKEKLAAEGMFSEENKRPLPQFPKRIAVITSPTGAAVQDILNILGRRNPMCEVVMCPVSVQGELAVPEMLDALERVYALCGIDIIIIGRGGGSIEDLWAFNSEELARKIYESPIPVISAVGHETDFTICDFVADLRAPTPSAAAELAVRDVSEYSQSLYKYRDLIFTALKNKYNYDKARLDSLKASASIKQPESMLYSRQQELDRIYDNLIYSIKSNMQRKNAEFEKTVARLDSLSPLKVLSMGYSVTELNGKAVTSVGQLSSGDEVELIFADGKANSRII